MQNHSSVVGKKYGLHIFSPESFLRRIVGAVLVWAMVISSLSAYAANWPSAQWVSHWDFASLSALEDKAPASPRAVVMPQQPQRGMRVQLAKNYRPVDLDGLMRFGRNLVGVSPFSVQGTSNSLLQISVGFADSTSASANFPEPWNEANPAVRFIGGGTSYRAGAIRLDNPTGSDITLDSVTVDLGRPGPVFSLWKNVVVPAFGSTILTQTADGNFNTSASPIASCGQALNAGETRVPKITLTVGGSGTDYLDTAHVLDTGGFDSSCRGNQSLQWRPLGTTDISSPAGSVQLTVEDAPHAVGTQNTVIGAVADAASQPLANAVVTLRVVNGPNAGKSFKGVTDSSGNAAIQYSSSTQGADLLQAVVNNFSGGSSVSQQVQSVWSSPDVCATPATPNAAATRLIYIGQNSTTFGNLLRLAALLTDGSGNPLSARSVAFSFSSHTISATTDANGVATLLAALPLGTSSVNASFTGDSAFAPVQVNSSVSVVPAPTLLQYTGQNFVASTGKQAVTALLTDALGRSAVANATVSFTLNGVTASATTDSHGVANATLNFQTAQPAGAAQLQINFAGNAAYKASTRTVPVAVFQSTGFVLWGGNSGGLKVGQRVNFWGAQWASQVTGGQYGANPSFKGFADTVGAAGIQQCQSGATLASLTAGCWQAKPGNSSPPATLPSEIEVIVSTAIAKSGSTIFGNIACGAVVKVDSNPPYGPDPGQPGFGTVVAVTGDCAGVFPKPANIVASQQQPSPVLPGQAISVTANLTNQGATDASSVTLNETFDQANPPSASQTPGTIAAGTSTSAIFGVTIPPITARQQGETSVDYETRLAALDAKLFTSTGEINFTDPFGQLYAPVEISSFSQLSLPRLSVGLSGLSCIAPGMNVPYQVTTENLGSATATQIASTLTFPDSTTATVAVPDRPAGTSFVSTATWQSPAITTKGLNESTQTYLSRLLALDGVVLAPATVRATWLDKLGSLYGPVEQPLASLTERVPVVSVVTPGALSLLPKQKAQFNFNVANNGTGNAVQVTLTLKRQDGSLLSVPNFSLPGGQSAVLNAIYSAPSVAQKGSAESDSDYLTRLLGVNGSTLSLDAILKWTDPAQNQYGPTDNAFTVREQLPIVSGVLSAPASANSGDTIAYTLTLNNSGDATATVSALVVLPDGSAHPLQITLAAHSSQPASFNFTVPANQPGGPITATASIAWSDAAANSYGPVRTVATTNVTQANLAPVVNAGKDQVVSLPVITATLSGTVTDDGKPTGGTLTSLWTQVSGPAATIASPASPVTTVTLTVVGTYVFRLTASDSQLSSSADVKVTLTPANQPPVVNAGGNQTVNFPSGATLNGSATDDGLPLGSTLTIGWNKVAGPGSVVFANANVAATQATFSAPGKYVLRLSANDSQFTVDSDATITVTAPDRGDLIVDAGPNQTMVLPASNATLNGTVKDTSPDADKLTSTWSKVAGPGEVTFSSPGTPVTSATFSKPGTYLLRLTASDTLLAASADVTIFVGKLACTRSNAGTDFWLVLAASFGVNEAGEVVTLNISGDTDTTGTVNVPSLGFTQSYSVKAGKTTTVTVPTDVVVRNSDAVESRGIHVTSQAPVSVYVLDFVPTASDGYMALPTTALGTEYVTVNGTNSTNARGAATGSEFAVVATQDATTITISASQRVDNRAARTPYQIVLNQGQTYQLIAFDSSSHVLNDLTGTLSGSIITSDKPVAVVSGHLCGNVPQGVAACNLLEEQLPPTNLWGTNFVTMPLATRRTNGDWFVMVASQDQTQLKINDVPMAMLNRGDFFEQSIDGPSSIAADKPILVAQMSKGGELDGIQIPGTQDFSKVFGDPFMALAPPYDQFGGSYTTATPATGFGTNYLNIVAPTAGIDNAIVLDGVALPAASFTPIGKTAFSGAQIPVALGSHHVASGSSPFGLTLYGFDNFDAYGYSAGACYSTEAIGTQVAITPRTLSSQIDSQSCLKVSTTDAGGQPLGGTGVALEIAGVNPQKTLVTTDATGTANFCYTGTNSGSDLIKATAGNATDTVTFTWTAASTNHAPIVTAGPDLTISLPQRTVTLLGSVIDDGLPAGAVVTSHWSSAGAASPPVIFSNPSSPVTQVQVSGLVTGTYTFQLSADDTQLVSSAVMHLTVLPANQPPVVSAGAPQTIYMQQVTVFPVTATLQGSVSDDGLPNGTLTTQWSEFSGTAPVTISTPASTTTSVTFAQPGGYTLALTASDGQLSTTAYTQVTVLLNQAPVVTVGPNQNIVSAGPVTATLSGTVKDDGLPVGSTVTFSWRGGRADGIVSPQPVIVTPGQLTTQVQLPGPGTYNFSLAASDGVLTSHGDLTIQVFDVPPSPPLASITSPAEEDEIHKPAPIIGSATGGKWTLDYRLNTDDGAATTAFTTFATGTSDVVNGTLGTFDPSLLVNGLYTVRLTVTNSSGQSSTVSVNITVARNRKLGFFTISFNDLSVPMPGFPVQIVRTYDSRDLRAGEFSFGWRLGLANIRLQKSRNFSSFWEETVDTTSLIPQYCAFSDNHKFVTITFPDGKVYKFEAGLSPQCQRAGPILAPTVSFTQVAGEAGTEGATLATADDAIVLIDGAVPGTFNLVQADGSSYNPTVFKLTTAEGFTYIIDQATGLKSVSDLNGNTLTVTPDGFIHSSGKSVTFQRDEQGRIASITDPQGNKIYYSYDRLHNDLQGFTDQAGKTWFYNYVDSQPRHMLAVITDPRGVDVLTNTYSSVTNQLILTKDAAGRLVQFGYQPASNQETIRDRNGNATTYTYDDDGNVVAVLDALGHTITMSYDALGNKLTEVRTDDQGRTRTTSFSYDGRSNLTSQTDPLGNVTTYAYNDRRQVTSITDPRGKVTQNAYDNQGNLLSTTDPLNHATTYAYLSSGLPKTVTDAAGNVTSFFYDPNGNLVLQRDALGHQSSFTYDSNNRKLTQTVPRTKLDGTTESLTTQYAYDLVGRLVKTTNPDGTASQTAYDSQGRRISSTDAKGNVTQYEYDTAGRMSRIGYPDQTEDTFAYDAEGHRTQISSHGLAGSQGIITNYAYDVLGRQVQTINADGGRTTTNYDALGQVASTTDARNNPTSYAYDDAGRRVSVTDAVGNVSKFAYDATGNQTSFTDALNHTTQYVYDDAGRRTKTIYPDQSTGSVTYDLLGRQTAKTDQAGKVTQFGYDALGRLITVTDALGQVTSYGYDELGNRTSQTDANQHTTSFVYDQLGRRSQRKLPLGQSESYSYDAVGNLTARTDFNGHTTTYTYDNMNRLLSKTADPFFSQGACAGGACGATQVSYTYTPTGRRASMTDASGPTTYTYDRVDRPLVKSTFFADVRTVWDLAGNQTLLRTEGVNGGASMSYTYDADNRLASVTDGAGLTTNYTYDAVGNLSSFAYPNGVSTSYTYNSLNRLTNMQSVCGTVGPGCGTPGTPISSYTYTLGAAGNRLSVVELNGRNVNYGYDDLYRLTSETIAGAAVQNGTISYQYDPVGNRKQLNSTVPAIPTGMLNYDANDRLSTDLYDNNGSTINNGGIGNIYDFENHLVQRGNVFIVYDGDGNRVSETVAGVATNYLVADINPTGYAQVIDEMPPPNPHTGVESSRSYTYGLSLISQRTLIAGTFNYNPPNFYGYDGHGSVRFLMDKTGAVTDTYDYDAFGNLINQTGTTSNNYLFAGEQFDPALGIYYNRARYYDDRNGRFWTADTLESSNTGTPIHRYLYADANPVNTVDPSGNESAAEAVTVGATIQTIAAITVITLEAACALQLGESFVLDELGVYLNPNAGPCVPKFSKERKVLYHYTAFPNLKKITVSGVLWASLDTLADAFFGTGQYFTDITPAEASARKKGELGFALYSSPLKWHNTDVAYIGVNLPARSARRVSDVYGGNFPGKGIYLRRSVTSLKLTNKIVDAGVLTFLGQ